MTTKCTLTCTHSCWGNQVHDSDPLILRQYHLYTRFCIGRNLLFLLHWTMTLIPPLARWDLYNFDSCLHLCVKNSWIACLTWTSTHAEPSASFDLWEANFSISFVPSLSNLLFFFSEVFLLRCFGLFYRLVHDNWYLRANQCLPLTPLLNQCLASLIVSRRWRKRCALAVAVGIRVSSKTKGRRKTLLIIVM